MFKIFRFFFHIKNLISFLQVPRDQRRLVFYSEGRNYWSYLEGLILEFLKTSDTPICYITSDASDPALSLVHPNFKTFRTDEGFIRNWLFENLEADFMVMTMPDLHQYQVKRSVHPVHYIYVQHSLVSLHMVYRPGAFDHFDTLFCAGPHHFAEARALEAQRQTKEKNLVEHGYGRLDSIIEAAKIYPKKAKPADAPKHVLLAPSWGPTSTIESGIGEKLVDQLLDLGCQVTLRPHPQTIIFFRPQVDSIVKKHKDNPLFTFEANVSGQDSLQDSDVMISDWSGAALDYAFGLKKPVLFVDVPKKINNPEWEEIEHVPFEVSIREKIGAVIKDGVITKELLETVKISEIDEGFFFQNSNSKGAIALKSLLGENLEPTSK
ncbi:MAG: CDP-glycerol glycerophosphotransferase family protein [SAR324 cluster bacterium]|nr:CDP-glycerol glycerophosphotransferase family protein [SAR324 cluster bacterium]